MGDISSGQRQRTGQRWCWWLAILCLTLVGVGCSGDGRRPVSGSVTVDGDPLEDGIIRFEPLAGTPGSGSGTAIVSGRYALPAEKGLFPGKFRVRIESHQLTGKMYNDVIRGRQPEILPVKFAEEGPREVEVEAGGTAMFDFSLQKAGYVQNDGSIRPLDAP
jgi:hypothetical protein